ncbi:MAG: MCE family protein [Bacteroidales bacterium]|nr:MCE family protein [Bacteroidales bacterium]
MEKRSIIKIGVLTVMALLILVWGLSFLKGENLFKTENEYVAIYDKLDGLQESNAVMLSGYQIGSVKSIGFEEHDNELKIVVRLKINNDFKIPVGTIVKIVSVDIMGTKGIEVIRPKKVTVYHSNGDTLKSAVDSGIFDQMLELVLPMKDDLVGFLTTSDSVMHALNLILNDQNRHNLTNSLANLEVVSEHLSENVHLIDSMINNFNKLSRTLGKNSANIDHAINNFASVSDTLAALELQKTMADASEALQGINRLMNTINSNNGTAQKILTNDTLYNNLEQMSTRINNILTEFEKHPKKYINLSIFGGKDKSYKYEYKAQKEREAQQK